MERKSDANWGDLKKEIMGDLSEMLELALERAVQRIMKRNGETDLGVDAEGKARKYYDVQERVVPPLVPIPRWNEFFDDPTERGLRWMLWKNKAFRKAVVIQRGKRILIDTAAYQNWLKTSGGEDASARALRGYDRKRSSESGSEGS